MKSNGLAVVLVIWFLAALAAGATGILSRTRPPAPQFVLLGMTLVLLALGWGIRSWRRWLAEVDLRTLVSLHLTRFVGFYFLYLHKLGQLPEAFATPAGWGDIAVAVTTAVVLSYRPLDPAAARKIFLFWNVFGFIDILMVVVNATRIGLANPVSMQALLKLPLSLLPTFLVPLIIASHVVIFVRLWLSRPAAVDKQQRQ